MTPTVRFARAAAVFALAAGAAAQTSSDPVADLARQGPPHAVGETGHAALVQALRDARNDTVVAVIASHPDDQYVLPAAFLRFAQQRNGARRVVEHLAHERVAAQQTVAQFVVMLAGIGRIRLNPLPVLTPILKANRVRCQDSNATLRQRRPKRLQRVTDQATHLTFAQMSFAIVLMVDEHGGKRSGPVRQQEIGGNLVIVTRECD